VFAPPEKTSDAVAERWVRHAPKLSWNKDLRKMKKRCGRRGGSLSYRGKDHVPSEASRRLTNMDLRS
jgi:hypothetical protein